MVAHNVGAPFCGPGDCVVLRPSRSEVGLGMLTIFHSSVRLAAADEFHLEEPDEWALVPLLSIPWWPILLGGAVVGNLIGKHTRQTEG